MGVFKVMIHNIDNNPEGVLAPARVKGSPVTTT